MKVLNKEVKECKDCPCLDSLDIDGSPFCTMLSKDIKDCNVIDKDCPFIKPITKEVIEGFGFIKTKSSGYNLFVGKLIKFNIIYNYNNRLCLIEKFFIDKLSERPNSLVLFKGTINNPIELEFILNSVGVIESK